MPIPKISSEETGKGLPLVLLHAFPLSHLIWEKIDPPAGYRMIKADFPGFGLSPIAPEGLTLQEAAQGLQQHLEERGIREPFALGGISMGGYWAMEFIRLFPQLVSKILFISTRTGVDKPEARQNRLNMADKVLREGTEFLIQAMVPGLLGKTTLTN